MKIFRAAALLALLSGPAYGQMSNLNLLPSEEKKARTPEEIEQDNAKDKAYRESIRKIPDAKAASDPWGNVRGPDNRKAAAEQKPRAKSGNSTGRQ
jgi:hypothetical protein